MKRLRSRGLARVLTLATLLVIVALAVGGCVVPPTQAPAATAAPAQAAPTTGVAAQTPASSEPIAASNLPAGVDAEGNFYRGDPEATVKLIEFSDFQ